MIKLENIEVLGFDHAIRGMRNPMNSWHLSDSKNCYEFEKPECVGCNLVGRNMCNEIDENGVIIGNNDLNLMQKLFKAGTDHRKFMRMITVYMDIIAPLYWWKQADQYRAWVTTNSTSTMHKIHDKEFTLDDFSHEHLFDGCLKCDTNEPLEYYENPTTCLEYVIAVLNHYRNKLIKTKDKKYWWQMIQLLPSSYNQKRTIMLNYEVLANMYHSRKAHKLDEWVEFCKEVEKLPYFKDICLK